MTDFDRNVRTLIVCFVLALVGLVPLRVFGGNDLLVREERVLGDMEEAFVIPVESVDDRVVLPEVGGLEY